MTLVFKMYKYSVVFQLENQLVSYIILSAYAWKFDFFYNLLPVIILFLNITVTIYRGTIYLLRPRVLQIYICMHQIMFSYSSNIFCNCSIVSGMVYTRVEVCRMDSEMSRLVERPWLQLMCYAIYLPCSHNFR